MDLIMRYLIALLFCFSLAAQQTVNNFTVKTNLTAQVINNLDVSIASFGAVGDGVTDNTTAIQAAIDKASQIGGAVRIPTGVFVTGPLLIKTNVFAIIGSQPGSEKFATEATCFLKLKNNATSSTVLTWDTGANAEVRNLFVDGNKANQTNSNPSIVVGFQTDGRDEVVISNFGVSNGKGWGLKILRPEVNLSYVSINLCDGGGIWYAGYDSGGGTASDCTLKDVLVGFNGGDGILFDGWMSGAQRMINCDVFYNVGDGIEFRGPIGLITGTQVQVNSNLGHGVHINGGGNGIIFTSSTFYGANKNDNYFGTTNSYPSGTFSDFYLSPSAGDYTAGIQLNGCRVGVDYSTSNPIRKPKHAVHDARTNLYVNGKGLSLNGNYFGTDTVTNFQSGLAISTNVYVSGVVVGNSRTDGTQVPSYIGNLTSTGNFTFSGAGFAFNPLFYQPEDGGWAVRYGPSSSYKYAVFYASGETTFPSGLIAEGQSRFGTAMVRYGYTGTNDYPNAVPVGTFSVSGSTAYLDSLTRSGTSFTFNPLFIRSSAVSVDSPLQFTQPAYGIKLKEGSNAKMGTATLVAGSAVVSTTSVAANSRIQLTGNADGGTPGWLRVSTRTAGTSFTITSSSATDTSTVAWIIFDPAP